MLKIMTRALIFSRCIWVLRQNNSLSVLLRLIFSILLRQKGFFDLNVCGCNVRIRLRSPDLEVAVETLGREFVGLSAVYPADFNGLIVDAGGYIGTAAIAMSRMYPRATVVTLEPSSKNFELLQSNVEDYPQIKPMKRALSLSNNQNLKLNDRGTGQWGFSVVQGKSVGVNTYIEDVDTISLEKILLETGFEIVSLFKCDIEGAEKELLENPGRAMVECPLIMIELHERIVVGCEKSFRDFSRNRLIVGTAGEKYLIVSKNYFENMGSSYLEQEDGVIAV